MFPAALDDRQSRSEPSPPAAHNPAVMVGAEIEKDSAVPVHTIALFAAAVLPLVITPGPDMLFVMSQGVSGGRSAVLKAVTGVLLGYSVHAVLAAMGVAAIVSASHILFEILRWAGVCYLGYLAAGMIRSAIATRGLLF